MHLEVLGDIMYAGNNGHVALNGLSQQKELASQGHFVCAEDFSLLFA